MSKKKKLPVVESVEIVDIAAEGKAIARLDNLVVFVPYVVPGDIVDLQLLRKRNKYAEARAVRFHRFSPHRREAFCRHFGVCGGCKWQVLPYQKQLEYKQRQVEDNLLRIGKVQVPSINPILGSAQTRFYRNKLEFTFSNRKWLTSEEISRGESFEDMDMNALGFHIPGMFDKVLDIETCWLQSDLSNEIRNFVRNYCVEHQFSFFDLKNQEGLMRNLIIRTTSTGDVMLIVVFYEDEQGLREKLLRALEKKFPQIVSLMYVINQKANDTIADQQVLLWSGQEYIEERMEGLSFKISPKSFYQTNSLQAYELYREARRMAGLTGSELVYDLYTGTGTIANFVASKAHRVIGIEYVEDAIVDAKVNSEQNGITNTLFFAGDMKDVLTADFIQTHGRPDVIITDPPRAGMHQDVIDVILKASPRRIVYVSCNPATQARDVALLDSDYKIKEVQPVDMFPHTHHVENIILLEKR